MRKLAIIIVSWNVRDMLRACLTSVYADLAASGLEAQIWVVDNASRDGSPGMVRVSFPWVRLLSSQENLGFAGGNNLALNEMSDLGPPRYVWLLNPDTEVRPGTARTLVDFMDEHPQVGVAGARLFYGDGRFQHSAFGFPGLWQILLDLFPLPGRFYESQLNGRYPRAYYERGEPFAVDHPLGASMMVRWAATARAGFFDKAFHMYCEEIDWCMRIKRENWEIYCVPRAEVVHHEGQSTGQIREESFVHLWRSRRRLYQKHYGRLRRWLAARLVQAGMRRKIRMARGEKARGELEQTEVEARVRACERVMAFFE